MGGGIWHRLLERASCLDIRKPRAPILGEMMSCLTCVKAWPTDLTIGVSLLKLPARSKHGIAMIVHVVINNWSSVAISLCYQQPTLTG